MSKSQLANATNQIPILRDYSTPYDYERMVITLNDCLRDADTYIILALASFMNDTDICRWSGMQKALYSLNAHPEQFNRYCAKHDENTPELRMLKEQYRYVVQKALVDIKNYRKLQTQKLQNNHWCSYKSNNLYFGYTQKLMGSYVAIAKISNIGSITRLSRMRFHHKAEPKELS